MRRQIVEHDSDALGVRKVNVGEFAHAGGEVNGGAAVGDLDLAPGPMRVEEDQQFDRSVVLILAVGAFDLAQLGRDRRANLADELGRVLIETDNWAPGIGRFGVAAVWWNVGAYTTAYAWREIDTDNGIKLCHCSCFVQ